MSDNGLREALQAIVAELEQRADNEVPYVFLTVGLEDLQRLLAAHPETDDGTAVGAAPSSPASEQDPEHEIRRTIARELLAMGHEPCLDGSRLACLPCWTLREAARLVQS
jgi:hypothetical protein